MDEKEKDLDTLVPKEDDDTLEHQEDELDYKALYEKEKQRADNQKIRAEKAEGKVREKTETKPQEKNQDLSSKDLMALMQNNVHVDDVDDVVKVAKLEGITVAEALKLDLTQTILSKKLEYRKTAEATNTSPARKPSQKVSDDTIVSNAMKGEIPKAGSEEAERLFWARRGGKK